MKKDDIWKKNQKVFGFTDAEMEEVKRSPKRSKIIKASPVMVRKRIIAEVIEAKNCIAHKRGDRYVVRANGILIKEESADNLCMSALAALLPFFYMAYDRIASGQDPNEMVVDHVGCFDTGVECGGFGKIMMKITVE